MAKKTQVRGEIEAHQETHHVPHGYRAQARQTEKAKEAVTIFKSPFEDSAMNAAYRGLADALVVTGVRTGEAPELNSLTEVKRVVPDRPVLVGSGMTRDNVANFLGHVDGAIVGTSFKVDGITENPIDEGRVKTFMVEVKKLRRLHSSGEKGRG